MRCLSCQYENPTGAKFCNACGVKLELHCPQCNHVNPAESRFCNQCGSSLVLSPESRVLSPPQHLTPSTQHPISYTPAHLAERIRAASFAEGERKTITALFADLKGSTALIEGLDPEEARAIIDPALQLMMDAVHRYDGYVAQALGDGIFALFGAPIAHEDHPQRALYAALRMQDEMRRYADQVRLHHGAPLSMRVGVNTGEVVVRSIRKDDLHTDYVPVGHSTNLAARMEQMATPGSILITEYTRKLVEGYFELKGLGAATIKGVETPLSVYEVLGAGPLRTRLQVAASRGLTRFVGRQQELEQLQRALAQAKAGQGQIVGTMGEPGLGKSRLFYEFKLLSSSGCLILEAYSVSHGKASPYLPLIELLKSYFRIEPQDEERTRRERVIGKVLGLDRTLEDSLPYLFALLGVEEQPSPLQQMDPQIRRKRTFEALKRLFLRESLNQPLVLIFEDLHWIDSETQGFLDLLSEGLVSAKILLLVNYRPEYRHEWGSKTYYTQLRLTPLGREEAEEFLDVLLGTDSSPQPSPQRGEGDSPRPNGERARVRGQEENLYALKQLILTKTQGTPFFMEEIVQELVEQGVLVRADVGADLRVGPREGAHTGAPLHIPPTVQGVLAARIDRLAPDEKALLQQLAVIGREFPLSLVRRVISSPEDELYRLLSALQRKEFLYEQPAFPEVEYLFKHALTQEVAYGSVLIERRNALHEQTGQAMEQLFQDRLEEHYPELAHHYQRSGNTEKAIEYLQKAGQQAVQRSANTEAIIYLTSALTLLETFPETAERAQRELFLQTILGPCFIATRGYASPEVQKVYERARVLGEATGEVELLCAALLGLQRIANLQAEFQTGLLYGTRLLQLAEHAHDSRFLVAGHHQTATGFFWSGDLIRARDHWEQSIPLYNPQAHKSLALLQGNDPGVGSLSISAHLLWMLGYPEQALKRSQDARKLARDITHPPSLALALGIAGQLYQLRREARNVQEQAEAVLQLATSHDMPYWMAFGTVLQGWALSQLGKHEQGIQVMQQGIVAIRATGAAILLTSFLARLADACGRNKQPQEGLAALTEALESIQRNNARWYESDLYRLKGELTLQQAGYRLQAVGFREKTEDEGSRLQVEGLRGKIEEAEGCFLQAIAIAQKQQAKSLELRATVSLVRLRQQQATQRISRTTHHETRAMLANIYNWFTEGFDTVDLKEAKTLLEELV